MKPLRKHLKSVALFLAVTFLMQSCMVYTYTPTTVDEAVKSGFANKIKVKTKTNESYKFTKIEMVNGQLIGLAKKQSETAKKLSNQITESSQFDYVKILLEKEQFEEIYIKKRGKTTMSTALPILVGCAAIIIAIFYFKNSGTFNMGSI